MDPLTTQIADFRSHLTSERRSSPTTVATYLGDLEALQTYCAEHGLTLDARALSTGTLRAFLASTFEGRTAATMARKVSAVRAFYRYLEKRGVVRDNPAARLTRPKVPKPLPEFVTVEDAFRVVEAPARDDAHSEALTLRDKAILELLYSSAARVSELAGLSRSSISLGEGQARVIGKGDKERLVPLGPECIAALEAYLPRRADLSRRCPRRFGRRHCTGV